MSQPPKVEVDFRKCQSNGLCEALAPAVFYLDDDDYLQFHKTELDDADLEPVRRGSRLLSHGRDHPARR